jgi:hypothetical protein
MLVRRAFIIVTLFAFCIFVVPNVKANRLPPIDVRFIVQSQAGVAAYAKLKEAIQLSYLRPIFYGIDLENEEYIMGDLQLAGRAPDDGVKLLAHRDGWLMAFHPWYQNISRLYDCRGYPYNTAPSYMPNRLETALLEVTNALNITDTVPLYYDFRNPGADQITLHWLLQRNFGKISSTIAPPLENQYFENAFAFCTITYYGEFYLNSESIARGDSTSVFGLLKSNQLRPGFTNTLEVDQGLIFFSDVGLLGGIATIYKGDAEVVTAGGYRRDIDLVYPEMIGPPIEIHTNYLPLMSYERE